MSDLDPIARALLDWYDVHRRRHLPWRERPSPYRTWLSEVMLQQTQVDTVIPYFERFLTRFPTVDDLARAPLDEVLGLWSGLGYYSRARNLHRAAARIAQAGAFPDTAQGLKQLPGVGDYIAGAVASIAFNRHVVAIDGNVERVVARLHAHPGGRRAIAPLVRGHLPEGRAGDFNQALMDLGATICRARSPACDGCPLSIHCEARRLGTPERHPTPKVRRPPVDRPVDVAVISRQGRVLLARRPRGGLYGGLFELPANLGDGKRDPVDIVDVLGELGLDVAGCSERGRLVHTLSHRRLHVRVLSVDTTGEAVTSGRSHYTALAWVLPDDPGELGISTLARKALALVPPPAAP